MTQKLVMNLLKNPDMIEIGMIVEEIRIEKEREKIGIVKKEKGTEGWTETEDVTMITGVDVVDLIETGRDRQASQIADLEDLEIVIKTLQEGIHLTEIVIENRPAEDVTEDLQGETIPHEGRRIILLGGIIHLGGDTHHEENILQEENILLEEITHPGGNIPQDVKEITRPGKNFHHDVIEPILPEK